MRRKWLVLSLVVLAACTGAATLAQYPTYSLAPGDGVKVTCPKSTLTVSGKTAHGVTANCHKPSPSPSPSRSASPSPSPSMSPTVSPTFITSPPPAAGYFTSTAPVGSWSSLPSDAQCAAEVHRSTWEPRPTNVEENHNMPPPGAMAQSFASRPRDTENTYNSLWDTWLLPRVDGQFTGTTDEILQWAACKWGLPDNLIRADAVVESTWFEYLHFTDGQPYWNRGSGDAFPGPTADSKTYCDGLADFDHDYQTDTNSQSYGRYPYTVPQQGMCPETFSILGIKSWENPAWVAPAPPYPGNQNGTFPFTRDSTAAAADYWAGYIRGCYEGWIKWLGPSGDLWGCIGSWYSGDWHSSAANTYISNVQTQENNHTWLQASFDNPLQNGQYHCDPLKGCPV